MNDLFREYQPELVKLANLTAGRKFLSIDHEVPKDKWIVKVDPVGYTYYTGRSKKVNGVYRQLLVHTSRCYPLIAKRLGVALSKLEITKAFPARNPSIYKGLNKYHGLLHYAGLFRRNSIFPQVMLDENAPFTSAGDGLVTKNDGVTWADARESAEGVTALPTTARTICCNTRKTGGGVFFCARGYFPYITSGIGAGATVDSSIKSIYIYAGITDADTVSWVLTESTQASMTDLVVGDFDALTLDTPTEYMTRVAYSALSQPAYNALTLDATGLAFIDVEGNTKFVMRDSNDVDDSEPTAENQILCSYSEQTGTTEDPKLVTQFTPPAVGGGNPMFYGPGATVG